jgi:hypothetical protein
MPFMNETSATTPKTAKHMADAFDASKFAMPKIEVPAEFREMTDKGVAHARDTCAKAMVASEEAGDLLKKKHMRPLPGGPQTTILSLSRLPEPTRAPHLTTPKSC